MGTAGAGAGDGPAVLGLWALKASQSGNSKGAMSSRGSSSSPASSRDALADAALDCTGDAGPEAQAVTSTAAYDEDDVEDQPARAMPEMPPPPAHPG